MINNDQRIQISRGKYIEENRTVALLKLEEKHFLKGEICMINYYKDPDIYSNIDVLVAIGIGDGIGKDFYRLISIGGTIPVRSVVTSLPDVSSLVHGEFYIYKNENNIWNYVYNVEEDGVLKRKIEKITGNPCIFIDIESGYRWFYEDQVCKREDEFFSSDIVEKILQSFSSVSLKFRTYCNNGWLHRVGEIKDISINFLVTDIDNNDLTKNCRYFLEGEEIELDDYNNYLLKNQSKDSYIRLEARYYIYGAVTTSYFSYVQLKFGYNFYYGIINQDFELNLDNLINLGNKSINYKRDFPWENINLNQQRVIFSYPKIYGLLNHIYDVHGIDYINSYRIDVIDNKIDNSQEYYVYTLIEPVSIINFNQIYSFSNSQSISSEDQNLIDIITSWKNKNDSKGLLELDEDGRIPKDLLDISASGIFPVITEIVNEFPNINEIEVGDIYFNDSTNKFMEKVSLDKEIYYDPKINTIYVYNNRFYYWVETGLKPLIRISFKKINKIEDIYG